MKGFFYSLLAFFIMYLTMFSGTLLGAFFVYQDTGVFSLTRQDFISPIKPAILALCFHVFVVGKLLPAKDKKDE